MLTTPDDPRVGHLLGRLLHPDEPAQVVLIGFPSNEGVRRNGGRPGAADAPAAIRAALRRLTPDACDAEAFGALLGRTRDLGDVPVAGDLEADQARLGEALGPHLASGAFAVVLGGGHETAFGHFLAHATLGAPVRILNWDAHTDVRELRDGRAHSGSPFRQAVTHPSGACERYVVAGLQPHSVAHAHLAFVRAHGTAYFRDALGAPDAVDAVYDAEQPTLVSFDLDAVDRAHAPGVSAPTVNGLSVPVWLRAAYLAGRRAAVRGVDVVELSPPHDVDRQTAALAALTVWHVLRGLTDRGEG